MCGQLSNENMTATAVIAYFNAGVEAEYMSMWSDAQSYYKVAH